MPKIPDEPTTTGLPSTPERTTKPIGAETPKNEKVAYVLSQGQTRPHHCHWPGCDQTCPPAVWGCKKHWFMLPKQLRDKVWAAYQPGQERTGRPSDRYVEVAREVREWILKHHPPTELGPNGSGLYLLRDAQRVVMMIKAVVDALPTSTARFINMNCPNCKATAALTVFVGTTEEVSFGSCKNCTMSWSG